MKVTEAPLKGVLIIEPAVFKDQRGYFFESFQDKRYQQFNIPHFVQDNISRSTKGVVRGMHYQNPNPQGKLAYVSRGHVWDVVVDIRSSSPTFGQWFGIHLDDISHKQIYIPPGFAHGYCVMSEVADFHYKCTDYYTPSTEHGIAWNDPNINIPWPIDYPVLSSKDTVYSNLNEINPHDLFA